MLTNKEAIISKNLLSLAKNTSTVASGIVCADHNSSMESAKKAVELNLIKPIFIGNKTDYFSGVNTLKNQERKVFRNWLKPILWLLRLQLAATLGILKLIKCL